ncbi:phage tail tape measure protein [Candidatus Peregrinibacteria bacterium]|nr:MAG: phage tail tape measure protein [Candidatus Peregrinibacteria bacterium]
MAFGMTNIIGELGIKITGYTSELSSSLKSATTELKGFGQNAELVSKVSHVAFLGIAAAATAMAAGLAISVKNAVEFEKGMTNIATIVDTNTESMQNMGNAVLDIAKRTPVQISDLTGALYEVRSAGISAGDALTVLEKSAQLGMAGLGTTAETVDIVTSSINAFKLKGEEAQNVYGYLFEATKVGKTTISDLAQGFGAVAGTVANANIELPEYLSAVAALTTTGLPASQAHHQLKAAIAGVTRESAELTAVLNQLGAKSFKDLIDKKGGMVNAFKAITEAVKGNDAAILQIFGSTEAYNAVIQLSGNLNGAYLETLNGMKNGTEDVTTAFEKQKNTVSAQWQTMKNNLDVLSIQVGSALLPALNQALQAVTAFIDKIPEIVAQLKDWVSNNDWVQGALIALGAILTGLAIAVIPSLIASLWALIATVATAAAPFVAVGLLITAIYVAIKNWDQITAFVQDVWNKVVDYTMKAWEWMKPYVETALRVVIGIMTGGLSELVIYVIQNWDQIKATVISFWDWIKPYLEIAVRAAFAVITFGMSELVIYTVQNWDEIRAKTIATWEAVKAFSETIWNAIVAFFDGIWTSIKKTFNAGLDAVDKAWTTTWNAVKDFTNNTWSSIKDLVTGGIDAVANIFYGGISIIGNAWRSIWDNVVNIVTGVFNTIQNTVNNIISWVQRALDKINIFKSEQASVGAGGSWSVGGFTFGNKQQVAGVVHGGEWVAPAWMVDKYAGVISQLESVRTRGYSEGGMVGGATTHNNQRTVHQTITQNIRDGVDFSIAARELAWRARFS